MQRILFFALFLIMAVGAGAQAKWDKPVQLKKCSVKIDADPFTATTVVEMEFYNPNEGEVEGLYSFQLEPGQAITGFRLDLNGKYREGSIEERWKAANAYNRVVGKRIDPALLQMESLNRYSLRIFPFAPRGTRKVMITIQQEMKAGRETIDYRLSMLEKTDVEEFTVNADVHNSALFPFTGEGRLQGRPFTGGYRSHHLSDQQNNLRPVNVLAFHIPISTDLYCTEEKNGQRFFAARLKAPAPRSYALHPKNLTVYWDISASVARRDQAREMNFLRQYLAYHNIARLTLITFHYRIQDTAVFHLSGSYNSHWDQYLKNQQYDGGTQLGCIDLTGVTDDAVLVFSDGRSSYGNGWPRQGTKPFFLVSGQPSMQPEFSSLMEESGGSLIDLQKMSVGEAVLQASRQQEQLLSVRSASGQTLLNLQGLPENGWLLVSGIMMSGSDSLQFVYGNTGLRRILPSVYLDARISCPSSPLHRLEALREFDPVLRSGNWQKILQYGKTQMIVTTSTAYLVFERVEDYITYNIQPPKELEEECERRSFVYRDNNQWYQQMERSQLLNGVVAAYNERIRLRNGVSPGLKFGSESFQKSATALSSPSSGTASAFNGLAEEVVVVGYSARKELAASVTTVRSSEIGQWNTVEEALQGRVAGLTVNPASPGMDASIRIRGLSSIKGEPLYVLDGMPLSGPVDGLIRPADIDRITVLKDASATAIYGSRGMNGVIVIESKKGRAYPYSNRPYRLKDMEDVDYLVELKDAPRGEKLEKYRELETGHHGEPGFYLDAANHLYGSGYRREAIRILSNAAEASEGNVAVMKAMAFVLEEWKEYEEAARVLEQVKRSSPGFSVNRDLAWVYYKMGQVQKAVDLLYQTISNQEGVVAHGSKAMLLDDLNAMIALHPEADRTGLPAELIRSFPADLRIVVDGNLAGISGYLSVKEPGGKTVSLYDQRNGTGKVSMEAQGCQEYISTAAAKGTYAISLNYYRDYRDLKVPVYVHVVTYRNFGRPGMTIETENVVLDNQNGTIEIATVKWP